VRDPAGGGCGGRPVEIRWGAPEAFGSAAPDGRGGEGLLAAVDDDCPSEARGAFVFPGDASGGGPDSSTIVRSGCDVVDEAREPAGSWLSGGVFFELTAYLPTSTPPWPQPPSLRIGRACVSKLWTYQSCLRARMLRARVSRYRPRTPKRAPQSISYQRPIRFLPESDPNPSTLMGNMAKGRNLIGRRLHSNSCREAVPMY
jgi:hypothetical protein